MNILIDTHIFLWWLKDDPKLSKSARKCITEADIVYVSAASLIEVAIKIQQKKLKADINELIQAIKDCDFQELPISSEHAKTLAGLPFHHRDPFDRILIAQAIAEPLQFLTSDGTLGKYSKLVIIS